MEKQIKVNAIKNGTVIDHIAAGKALRVIDILNLKGNSSVMIGMNLHSNKIGKKDIIKIENRELSANEVNSISLIAPESKLIIIKNFKVISKSKLQIPDKLDHLIVCPNPNCITNLEKVKTKFKVVKKSPIVVRCLYCEKKYAADDVKVHI